MKIFKFWEIIVLLIFNRIKYYQKEKEKKKEVTATLKG